MNHDPDSQAVPSPAGPTTDHEWTIHSLNIHGIFFERWCQQVIREKPNWTLKTTNYPVEVGDHRSNLDIRADLVVGDQRVILLIECKKNNPEFVDWIFFQKQSEADLPIFVPQIKTIRGETPSVEPRLSGVRIRQRSMTVVNEARETKGSYQSIKPTKDKTKTSNSAITDAANQIALATQAIYIEQKRWAEELLEQHSRFLHPITNIVPMIVTTARLWVCDFNPQHVDGNTGEIPFDKASLSNVPRVVYEFPLPQYLQTFHLPDSEQFVRRPIIIVHSSNFADFLANHAYDFLPS